MLANFDDLTLIPHTQIFRAVGISDTYGNRRLQECVDAGIVKDPFRTVTGRTLLTIKDGRAFYKALNSPG